MVIERTRGIAEYNAKNNEWGYDFDQISIL